MAPSLAVVPGVQEALAQEVSLELSLDMDDPQIQIVFQDLEMHVSTRVLLTTKVLPGLMAVTLTVNVLMHRLANTFVKRNVSGLAASPVVVQLDQIQVTDVANGSRVCPQPAQELQTPAATPAVPTTMAPVRIHCPIATSMARVYVLVSLMLGQRTIAQRSVASVEHLDQEPLHRQHVLTNYPTVRTTERTHVLEITPAGLNSTVQRHVASVVLRQLSQ